MTFAIGNSWKLLSTAIVLALVILAGSFYFPPREQQSGELQPGPPATSNVQAAVGQQDVGEAAALFRQAQQYERGEGVQKNRVEAGKLYVLAAQQGLKAAQVRLTEAKTKCTSNVQPDGALNYDPDSCFIAAATDDPRALHAVGVAFLSGRGGVPQDKLRAFDWLTKAARAGSSMAAIHLAIMYDRGDGIPPDHEEAVAWFTVAEGRPDLDDVARKAVKVGKFSAVGKLTFKQIHEANLKAITYKKLIPQNKNIRGEE